MYDVPKRDRDIKPEEVRELVGRDDPLIIDAGANDGQSSADYLRAMPNARILAIEIDPRPLARFMLRNHPNVTLVETCISHRRHKIQFHPSGGTIPGSSAPCASDWDYSGSVCKPTGHLIRDSRITFEETRTMTVDAFPLDDIALLHYGTIDFIHADLQGAEPRMILGGQQTLQRTRWLYLETHKQELYERQADLRGLLSFLPDWELVSQWSENSLFKNRVLEEETA